MGNVGGGICSGYYGIDVVAESAEGDGTICDGNY